MPLVPQTPGVPDHAAPEPTRYDLVPASTVEPKVKASTAGAGVGAAVSAFLVWLADELWWGGQTIPPEVPLPVSGLIGVLVTSAAAAAGGYWARHVNRAG